MERYALICGCDYSGGWKVYQSVNDAKKFEGILGSLYGVKDIRTLYQEKYTRKNILDELKLLASKLNGPNKVGIIYVAGHGTQTRDHNGDELDGKDENWQTYDRRNVIDDEITAIMEGSHPGCHLTIISDCCHSGSMLDYIDRGRHKYEGRNWLSIGSAMDNQSAIQSGDGSVCSYELFKILQEEPTIIIAELKIKLLKNMRESFIGGMQTAVIHISNNNLLNQKVFS